MNLSTIEEQLKNWHLRKFGRVDLDVAATMRKFGEEVGEFMEAVINGEPGPIAEEAGDVLFIMCHIVREFGGAGALNEAVVAKLETIYDRLQAEESGRDRVRALGEAPVSDFDLSVPCLQKCDGCGARFRCLDAGVPIPLKVQTGGRLGVRRG